MPLRQARRRGGLSKIDKIIKTTLHRSVVFLCCLFALIGIFPLSGAVRNRRASKLCPYKHQQIWF